MAESGKRLGVLRNGGVAHIASAVLQRGMLRRVVAAFLAQQQERHQDHLDHQDD